MKQLRIIYLFILILLTACGDNHKNDNADTISDSVNTVIDSSAVKKSDSLDSAKQFANERFKEVTVKQVGTDQYVVEGKAQIFEANFGWVVEDGHNELKKGFEMADAGAPDMGKF